MNAAEVPTELVEAIAPYVLDGDLHKARRALAAVLPLAYAEAMEHAAKRISPYSGIGLAHGATRGDVAVWLLEYAAAIRGNATEGTGT